MVRSVLFAGLVGVMLFSSGCCRQKNNCGPFAQTARVPAPGTYQLNIPSLAGRQPYYTPTQNQLGAAQGSAGILASNPTVNPNTAAPTMPASNQNLNGWTQSNNHLTTASNAPVYQSPYGAVATPTNGTGYRISSSTTGGATQSNNGSSVTAQGTNLRTDSTRLAATDATHVRGPVATGTGFGATPANGEPTRYLGTFNQPQSDPRWASSAPGIQGSYQSPYIRHNGSWSANHQQPGVGSNSGTAIGWVPRENGSANR